jgi:hypothetical protein
LYEAAWDLTKRDELSLTTLQPCFGEPFYGSSKAPPRHCERSEAIHLSIVTVSNKHGLLRRIAVGRVG